MTSPRSAKIDVSVGSPDPHGIITATSDCTFHAGALPGGPLDGITVTAVEHTELVSLAREPFLEAVRGTDEALSAADESLAPARATGGPGDRP